MLIAMDCLCHPKIHVKTYTQGVVLGGINHLWKMIRSWEKNLMNGISAPIKVTQESSLCPLPSEGTRSQWSATQKGALPRTWPHWHPHPGLQASEWWVINFCCLKTAQSMVFYTSSPNKQTSIGKWLNKLFHTFSFLATMWYKFLSVIFRFTHFLYDRVPPSKSSQLSKCIFHQWVYYLLLKFLTYSLPYSSCFGPAPCLWFSFLLWMSLFCMILSTF